MKTRTIIATLLAGMTMLAPSATTAQDAGGDSPPPWEGRAMAGKSVPNIYRQEWRKAKNRTRCQPLVLLGAEREPGVKTRRAEFSGGWAVAYDLPGQRSAYGIAGAGVEVDGNNSTYNFPNSMTWNDGSSVSYGLEGGTGPGYLAYLKVSGQSCLYNIWSKRGQTHLEHLISTLRRVKTRP